MSKVLMPYFGGDPYNSKEYLKMERLYYEAEAKVIFNSAINSIKQHMISVHPFSKKCPIEGRRWLVRTKCFYPEMMWKLISEVKSITCTDNDGVVRTFEIKKIEPLCNEPKPKKRRGGWGLEFYF